MRQWAEVKMDGNQKYEHKYGLVLDRQLSDMDLELLCFLHDYPPEKGGLGKAGHFKRFVSLVWGPGSPKEFIWHPWAERMVDRLCKHQYLGVVGCGNSSKTTIAALWALVNWLAARFSTKVLVTSTSLKESRKRIWGAIVEYYQAARVFPGKLVDSMGLIRSADDDSTDPSALSGIELIPGEKSKEKLAIGKLIGIKSKRVILICDELPELSEALLSAAYSNLALNPNFQLVGIGNFASMYDPLGVFVKPKGGYNTITTDDEEWETDNGICIRFDGLHSPNIISGRDEFPMIYTSKDLRNHRQTLGENTALFWRMCRSFPCPEGEEHAIYTEADLNRGNVHGGVVWWQNFIKVAALDPGFTNGGDRSVMITADYGRTREGLWTIAFDKVYVLEENVLLKDQSRNRQIGMQFVNKCKEAGIKPEHTAYDSSAGGGIMVGELLTEIWSEKCLGVNFGGRPSDLPVSMVDERKASDAYYNRVSELWYVGVGFVISGQIKRLPREVAMEWKARRYVTTKIGQIKSRVESKTDMKDRTGKSPDIGDAAVMIIDLCRERLGAVAGGGNPKSGRSDESWADAMHTYDEVYHDMYAEAETV